MHVRICTMPQGSNYSDYGEGQLVCEVGGEIIAGLLLSSSRVLCLVPANSAAGIINVRISLNGGLDGTFAQESLPVF